MILYATRETFIRFKLKMPNEMLSPSIGMMAQAIIDEQRGDKLLEWGVKLFYFDGRKCMQVVNFASKLTLFLIDIKVDDVPDVADYIARYLMNIYEAEPEVTKRLERFFREYPVGAFTRLTNKSIIATLNHTQRDYLDNGYRLYSYVENGILQSRKINKDINREWCFTEKVSGKTVYFTSADKFKSLLLKRYPKI